MRRVVITAVLLSIAVASPLLSQNWSPVKRTDVLDQYVK